MREGPTENMMETESDSMWPKRKARPKPVQLFYARSRVQKDILELNENRHHAFQPHAKVTFDFGTTLQHQQHKQLAEVLSFSVMVEPNEGAYCSGCFTFKIEIPNNFPFCPPIAYASAPIYHPNINPHNGLVSFGLINKDWSPVIKLETVVLGIVLLFVEPSLDSAVNDECTRLLSTDRETFLRRAHECSVRCRMSAPKLMNELYSPVALLSRSSSATSTASVPSQFSQPTVPIAFASQRKRGRVVQDNYVECEETSTMLRNLELQGQPSKRYKQDANGMVVET